MKEKEEKNKKLKENNIKIQEEYKKEINKLEEWSFTKYKEMILSMRVWRNTASPYICPDDTGAI